MFTREVLDSVLPPGDALNAAVRRSLFECFNVDTPYAIIDLEFLLAAMAGFVEMHAGFRKQEEQPWQVLHSPEYEYDWSYTITVRGVDYKPRSNYLTLEGWPTGTTCWFVTVDYGWRENITAPGPLLAVLRAIIVLCAVVRTSKTAPSKRREVLEVMKQIMQEGEDAAGTIQG